MSLSLLKLHAKAAREPHWHPNANELSYCLEGKALITLFGPKASHDTFTIEPGEIAFIPRGTMHHIENIGRSDCRFLLCFDHDKPEDLDLSSSVASMSNHVLGSTFKLADAFFKEFVKPKKSLFIAQLEKSTPPALPYMRSRYKLNLEGIRPQLRSEGGLVKMSNSTLFPLLENLAVYSLVLYKGGIREPHWHPNASELNYLISGQVRITILSPNGRKDSFEMKEGDISFIPRGYFHDIENCGSEEAHLAVFFNHEAPSDIGLSGAMSAYPKGLLSSLFKTAPHYLDKLPKYHENLLIVSGGG